jgi:hypothetical protein
MASLAATSRASVPTLAVSVTQRYTLPSQLNSSVSSLVFPGTDRVNEPWASETASNFVRHGAAAIAAAQTGGAGAATPRDIPDYAGAAEYAKRNFVKLGYAKYDAGDTENKAAFPRHASATYANPRAAKVAPPSGTGLYFGSEPALFETDSRANFLVPAAGADRGPSAAERKAINLCVQPRATPRAPLALPAALPFTPPSPHRSPSFSLAPPSCSAVNRSKFTLGVEPAPGGGFETTSRHAAAHMLAAAASGSGGGSARGGSGAASARRETAAELAKVTHINFPADRHPHDVPSFETTQRAGLPRHATAAYAERQGPCDPRASMGALAAQGACSMVLEATGEVVTVPRVQSGLDMGRDAPVWQTEAMAVTGQAVKQNPGGKKPALVPQARPLKLVRFHPAIAAAGEFAQQ